MQLPFAEEGGKDRHRDRKETEPAGGRSQDRFGGRHQGLGISKPQLVVDRVMAEKAGHKQGKKQKR